MWIEAIDHIQITSSPDAEDAMLFCYSNILGLTEISKPENLKANSSVWYLLGDIQLHTSTEKIINNEASRRHICFREASKPTRNFAKKSSTKANDSETTNSKMPPKVKGITPTNNSAIAIVTVIFKPKRTGCSPKALHKHKTWKKHSSSTIALIIC